MWTVIYIAPNEKVAEFIKEQLTKEGILVKVSEISYSKQQYEIRVPNAEVLDAQEILTAILS